MDAAVGDDDVTGWVNGFSSMQAACMLNMEIQGVMSMMRQNAKWAVVPRLFDEDLSDDPLLQAFKALRRRIFLWQDWSQVDPALFLAPFLEVIRSAETSGPITGMALSAVYKVLTYGLIGPTTPCAAEVMHLIADATTHCLFEATDTASDEVVLMKILQVLLALLKCPTGRLLSDDDVCHIVETTYNIGHRTGKEGEMLKRMSRHMMQEMVRHIYRRVKDLPVEPLRPHHGLAHTRSDALAMAASPAPVHAVAADDRNAPRAAAACDSLSPKYLMGGDDGRGMGVDMMDEVLLEESLRASATAVAIDAELHPGHHEHASIMLNAAEPIGPVGGGGAGGSGGAEAVADGNSRGSQGDGEGSSGAALQERVSDAGAPVEGDAAARVGPGARVSPAQQGREEASNGAGAGDGVVKSTDRGGMPPLSLDARPAGSPAEPGREGPAEGGTAAPGSEDRQVLPPVHIVAPLAHPASGKPPISYATAAAKPPSASKPRHQPAHKSNPASKEVTPSHTPPRGGSSSHTHHGSAATGTKATGLATTSNLLATPPANATPAPAVVMLGAPYGLACLAEVFRFLCSLLGGDDQQGAGGAPGGAPQGPGPPARGSEDSCLFSLGLINSALEVGTPGFSRHPQLLGLVQGELFKHLMQWGLSNNLSILSGVYSLVLHLYCFYRKHLKLQLEAFFLYALLRVAEGKGHNASYEQQEAAVEALVDLCRQPSFMTDMFINFDCDLYCRNVFEAMCNLLSKNSFPVNCPLSPVHLLSLEGLLAVVHGIAERASTVSKDANLASFHVAAEADPSIYVDFWEEVPNMDDPVGLAEFHRRRRYMKRRLAMGVDHFNRDPKKGLAFLQSANLLPTPITEHPRSLAKFFRHTPGLNKVVLGEFVGEPGEFNIAVLRELSCLFDFEGMTIDAALRTFLDTFRLPGEAQKIGRVLEAFAARYHAHCGGILADADAAYVLSYSVIMLNTDQHNSQVKKKMSQEEFARNNRAINAGQNLPRAMIDDIYNSICRNEIKMSGDSSVLEMNQSRWLDLLKRSRHITPFASPSSLPLYDRDMFAIMWGPTIAAISVVFDHADDEEVLREALDGFISVAKISAHLYMEDVLDNLVVSLCKFTTLLNPTAQKPCVAFGEDIKARMAALTVFSIANKFGDYIRAGWRNILDCVLRLHKLGLLPSSVTESDDGMGDGEQRSSNMTAATAALAPAPLPLSAANKVATSSSSSILRSMSTRFSSFLSLDSEPPPAAPTELEIAAQQRTLRCIEACHIDDIFSDSKFLQAEALSQLAKALVWAAGQPHKSPEDEDTAVFCLDLLITVTLRNRDRIQLLWPLVTERLESVIGSATAPGPLVDKAVFSLLRICRRLLPYKADMAEELLQSLKLLLKLDAKVADVYAERIMQDVLRLVRVDVTYIQSPLGWKTVLQLLEMGSHHPEAAAVGFEALLFLLGDASHVRAANFLPCLKTARAYAESRVGGPERSIAALDLLAGMGANLAAWAEEGEDPTSAAEDAKKKQALVELWLALVAVLCRLCLEMRVAVRHQAVILLQRALLLGDVLAVNGATFAQCLETMIFPMVKELISAARKRSGDYADMETSLRKALALLSKTFLHYSPLLRGLPGFGHLWLSTISCMEQSLRALPSEQLVRGSGVPQPDLPQLESPLLDGGGCGHKAKSSTTHVIHPGHYNSN
eukprot:jgi/Mesvir1/23573/Mv18269-RA.2